MDGVESLMSEQTQSQSTAHIDERVWHQWYEDGVPRELSLSDHPLDESLRVSAERYPKRDAIRFFGGSTSYRKLDEEVNRFANVLIKMGVEPGDRIAFVLPNCPQLIICYYGSLRAGAVVVPTSPLYTEREMQHQLADSEARVVICLSRLFSKVQNIRENLPDLEHVIVTNIKEHLPVLSRLYFTVAREKKEGHHVDLPDDGRTHSLPDLMKEAGTDDPGVDVSIDDLAALQYTAGTTGTPKGVMLPHRTFVVGALHAQIWTRNVERPQGHDVVLGVIPIFHPLAQTTVMNYPISAGATMVLLPRFSVAETLQAINDERPNMFPGVPALFRAVLGSSDLDQYQIDSLMACISGAAPLPVDVQDRFEELAGVRMVEGYGSTEAPVTHCNPMLGTRKEGSIGVPLPSTDAAIFDLETRSRRLETGEVGELAVRGPQVMLGYWKQEEKTAEDLRDGWFFTGDTGSMDEDGFFTLVDRKNDLMIVSGFNVFPSEVENVIRQHPKVADVAVAGVPDPGRGEVAKAFVVPQDDEDVNKREIIALCREHLANYKVPRDVEFRDDLPRNVIGKVLRRQLIEEETGDQA
jgi:long-chain acyl-CoA synthetase